MDNNNAVDYETIGFSQLCDSHRELSAYIEHLRKELTEARAKLREYDTADTRPMIAGLICEACGEPADKPQRFLDRMYCPACFCRLRPARGEEFRAGLPAEALRKVWAEWEERDRQSLPARVTFAGETLRYESWRASWPNEPIAGENWNRGHAFRPRGKTWSEVERMAREAEVAAFEQPTMNCPRCGKEYPDFDGVGVVYCAHPGCGFCRHVSRSGQADGSMKCDLCGDVKEDQPERAKEVPAWRRELERLRGQSNYMPQHRMLIALTDLAALAAVIESGKGEAVVPEWVAKYMLIKNGGHHPAGKWIPSHGVWVHEGLAHSNDPDYILAAIDAYGNTIIGGDK